MKPIHFLKALRNGSLNLLLVVGSVVAAAICMELIIKYRVVALEPLTESVLNNSALFIKLPRTDGNPVLQMPSVAAEFG